MRLCDNLGKHGRIREKFSNKGNLYIMGRKSSNGGAINEMQNIHGRLM